MNSLELFEYYYRHVSAHQVYQKYYGIQQDNNELYSQNYIGLNCSADELRQICSLFEAQLSESGELHSKEKSIFHPIIGFTKDRLVEKNGEPLCRYEKLLQWFEPAHQLGQDLFTTAFFAYRDCVTQNKRHFFAWVPIVKSDNTRLAHLLQKGVADNHFHLKGSSQNFALNWLSLMNDVTGRQEAFETLVKEGRLSSGKVIKDGEIHPNMSVEVTQAALIRAYLFCQLKEINLIEESHYKGKDFIFVQRCLGNVGNLRSGNSDYLEFLMPEIQQAIDNLKYHFGYVFDKEFDGCGSVADYAIGKNQVERNVNTNLLLVGERWFLYDMFKAIYSKDRKIGQYQQDLFYAYLLIKIKFRAELVQVNDRVGFANFAEYQDRKSYFLKNPVYKRQLCKMAIQNSLENQSIKSLEARIAPEASMEEMCSTITKFDEASEEKCSHGIDVLLKSWQGDAEKKKRANLYGLSEPEMERFRHFYTLHFIKERDKQKNSSAEERLVSSFACRHHNKREQAKQQSFVVRSLRASYDKCSQRIFGIDAAANEIGCRPEVFAQAFRYLREHKNSDDNEPILSSENINMPKLRATYHAGEDFLDIVDGLRAIEESIYFLNLTHGDRIGHALALGIDVGNWYDFKCNKIALNKHDFLDNIVWLINKIRDFNLCGYDSLIYQLGNEYGKLFYEIYESSEIFIKSRAQKNFSYRMIDFYNAGKLRGDAPELYMNGECEEGVPLTFWSRCSINRAVDESLRKNHKVTSLYHHYHYNPDVKRVGNESMEYRVSADYINAVKEVQYHMQLKVRDKGIGIECNPTSNYWIGTFRRYDKHPIMNFYNMGLETDPERLRKCPQLFVSINTDDQGIFDTYLENEYALMALALEKAVDEKGCKLYSPAMVYEWLDRIREMGLEQSFDKMR